MPDPVALNFPTLYSVPLHLMQEYGCFATGDLLSSYGSLGSLPHGADHTLPASPKVIVAYRLSVRDAVHLSIMGTDIERLAVDQATIKEYPPRC